MRSFFTRQVESDSDFARLHLRPALIILVSLGTAIVAMALILSGAEPRVGTVLLMAAVLVSSYAPTRIVVMNRTTNELLVIKRRRVFAGGADPTEVQCTLSDIAAVEVVGKPDNARSVRTELVMADGSRLPVERQFTRATGKHRALAAAIERFLADTESGDEQ